MKKFGRYILYVILLSVFVLAVSAVNHALFEKLQLVWLFYQMAVDYLYYIPIIAGLSILWPLVIKGRSEIEASITPAATGFFIIVYIFAVIAGCVAFQEIAVPALYENAKFQTGLKAMNIRAGKPVGEKSGKYFNYSEFDKLGGLPYKNNIAFAMNDSFVYIKRMVKSGGNYYVFGFKMITYQKGGKAVKSAFSRDRAKIVNDEVLFSNAKGDSVPLIYDANGIYNLSKDSSYKESSLIDIFRYNNYVTDSKINFYHVGNMVFNKIAYYITVILILIILSSFGSAFRSQRSLFRDYIQTVCFYVISFAGVALMYDILISIVNMVFGLVV
jgi:hypothetical protein